MWKFNIKQLLILRDILIQFCLKYPFFISAFMGGFFGLVLFLVHISNFFSYLSENPKTCMNCHIMGTQYATWMHSSHREVTTCNDCHVPQDNFFNKMFFKAMDGLRHSYIFTMRGEPQAIIIKEAGKEAVSGNCRRCHEKLFVRPTLKSKTFFEADDAQDKLCWNCHRDTPHGRVRSLASSPYAKVPTTESMIPAWLTKAMQMGSK